jgi:uncharacterized membrane protein YeaQ/YmgE (transglycosylase-associated protein family)
MGILWTILIGFVVGLIARMLKPGNDGMGMILTTLVGIGGALAATFIGGALGWYAQGEAAGFIGALVGAIVILFVVGAMRKGKAAV